MAEVKLEIVMTVGVKSAILEVVKGLCRCLRRDALIMVGEVEDSAPPRPGSCSAASVPDRIRRTPRIAETP